MCTDDAAHGRVHGAGRAFTFLEGSITLPA